MKRNALLAAVALLFAGAAQAAVTEFVIYKQNNFRGPSHTVKGEVNVLEGGFAREAASLRVKGGYWEACTGNHFKGNCRVFGPGEYPSLEPGWHQSITSVRFLGTDAKHARREQRRDEREARREARGAVDIYGRQDFRGRSVRIERNAADLAEHNFDGRASSLVVHEGVWEACTEPGFRGRCEVFRPGEYRYLAGLDDRLSSIRQVQ
jgi:hypothetical protein